MAAPQVRSSATRQVSEAFMFPPRAARGEPVRPPTRRARRSRGVRSVGIAWLALPLEVLLGGAIAAVPVLMGLPLGAAIMAVPMGGAVVATALTTPAAALPLQGQRLYDRYGIDALLVGLAALFLVFGEQSGTVLFVVAAAAHAALVALGRRLGSGSR
jgi:hypothetical protein